MNNNLDKTNLISIRNAKASDMPFILATWLRGLKFGNNWYKMIDNDIYYSVYHKVITSLLAKPTISVKIACLKDDNEVILGYSVYEEQRLHWVHIKKAWRNIGIAKSLVPDSLTSVSHLTEAGKSIFNKKNKWIFNPFFIT